MAKVILGMTMSLDGFVNDRRGGVDVLYPDLAALRDTPSLREAIARTGAVVMGWNAFAMAADPDWYAGNYEFQVPIFVLTREAPKIRPKEAGGLTFTFVTDGIAGAVGRARTAAGGKDVTIIGGAGTARQSLKAGLVDELHVDVMPVLLGGGLRLFDDIGGEPILLGAFLVLTGLSSIPRLFGVLADHAHPIRQDRSGSCLRPAREQADLEIPNRAADGWSPSGCKLLPETRGPSSFTLDEPEYRIGGAVGPVRLSPGRDARFLGAPAFSTSLAHQPSSRANPSPRRSSWRWACRTRSCSSRPRPGASRRAE